MGVNAVHNRIQAIITAKKMKKTDFAQKLNISSPFVSELCSGAKSPSDRTIADICREFNVNEEWLRTGIGEMFIEQTPDEQIAACVGDALSGTPNFRRRFLSVLSRMTPEEWRILERKVMELAVEIETADPEGPADPEAID